MKKPIKVATAKALKEMDYKLSEIADLLGISYRTAWRYTNEDTDDNWAKFVNDVKRLIDYRETELSSKTLMELEKKMPNAQFKELADWYIKLKDTKEGRATTLQQFNVGGDMSLELVGPDNENKT